MIQPTNEQILEWFLPRILQIRKRLEENFCDTPESEFALKDLFTDRTFEEMRVIKNSTKYHPNPECFDVAMCRTGSMFLFERWSGMKCAHLNAYWKTPNGNVKYAHDLFSQSHLAMAPQLFEAEQRKRGYG